MNVNNTSSNTDLINNMVIDVSIIIPYYNQAKYIQETVESVLAQRFQSYEIIIVNDGSTDEESIKVLNELSHPKIFIYHIENQGVCAARNYGYEKSSGKYLLFLDGDDKISKDFIAEAVPILETRPEVKAVSCRVELFGEKSGEYMLPEFSLDTLIARNILIITCLIRSKDFAKTPGFNDNMRGGFEDWDFWLSLLGSGGEVFRLDTVGFYYRIRKVSRNHTIGSEKMRSLRKQIYLNHRELYSSRFLDPYESFEFQELINSKEFKIGKVVALPLRKAFSFIKGLKS